MELDFNREEVQNNLSKRTERIRERNLRNMKEEEEEKHPAEH